MVDIAASDIATARPLVNDGEEWAIHDHTTIAKVSPNALQKPCI